MLLFSSRIVNDILINFGSPSYLVDNDLPMSRAAYRLQALQLYNNQIIKYFLHGSHHKQTLLLLLTFIYSMFLDIRTV